jgi:hypothetical protein
LNKQRYHKHKKGELAITFNPRPKSADFTSPKIQPRLIQRFLSKEDRLWSRPKIIITPYQSPPIISEKKAINAWKSSGYLCFGMPLQPFTLNFIVFAWFL